MPARPAVSRGPDPQDRRCHLHAMRKVSERATSRTADPRVAIKLFLTRKTVDFILGDRLAIEVKAKKNVSDNDLRRLRALREEKRQYRDCTVEAVSHPALARKMARIRAGGRGIERPHTDD